MKKTPNSFNQVINFNKAFDVIWSKKYLSQNYAGVWKQGISVAYKFQLKRDGSWTSANKFKLRNGYAQNILAKTGSFKRWKMSFRNVGYFPQEKSRITIYATNCFGWDEYGFRI